MFHIFKKIKLVLLTLSFIFIFNSLSFSSGWQLIGNDYYWVNDDGSFYTGFVIVGKVAFYCGEDGRLIRAPKGKFKFVDDNLYHNQFCVNEDGVVSMCVTDGGFWTDAGNAWYHFNKYGVLDKDTWVYYQENDKIYRLGHDGKMQRGWVIDPETSIYYYCNDDPKDAYVMLDNIHSSYDEIYDRLIAVINKDSKVTQNILNSPMAQNG